MNVNTNPEQRKLGHIYGAFGASILLQFMPLAYVQLVGFFLFCIVLVWAYVLRRGSERESFVANHTTYIIRTIWIASLFLSIGIIVATMWFLQAGDHSVLDSTLSRVMGQGSAVTPEQINGVMRDYIKVNMSTLLMIGAVTVGPGIVYIIYRLTKGVSRALKGHRIGNVKSWL